MGGGNDGLERIIQMGRPSTRDTRLKYGSRRLTRADPLAAASQGRKMSGEMAEPCVRGREWDLKGGAVKRV